MEAKNAERRQHEELLSKAAGISSVPMICHRDTWLFIRQHTPNESVFSHWTRSPDPDDSGLIRINLSGPNLVTLLASMRNKLNGWHPASTEALAERVYGGVAQIVAGVDPDAKDGKPIPSIVIDDKIGPPPDPS